MAEEFKIRNIRPEIKEKLNTLFSELKDAQKVYLEANKRGYEVGYPEVVAYLLNNPLARTLPLDPEFKERRGRKSKKLETTVSSQPKKLPKINLELIVSKPKNTETLNKTVSFDNEPKKELYNALIKILQYKAAEKGWAHEQATIFDAKTTRRYDFAKTIEIFQTYESRKESVIPLSAIEISKEHNVKLHIVKKIIDQIEGAAEPITADLDERIKSALEIKELSIKEAAYFLGIPKCALANHIKKHKMPYFKKSVYHNFIEASKIYEAADAGFDLKETAEYSKVNKRNTEHYLRRRIYIEPQLIEILKKIYPDKEINKPYI
jgi:hypothetical protein